MQRPPLTEVSDLIYSIIETEKTDCKCQLREGSYQMGHAAVSPSNTRGGRLEIGRHEINSLEIGFLYLKINIRLPPGHIWKTCDLKPFRIQSSAADIGACSHLTPQGQPSDPLWSLPEQDGPTDWQPRGHVCHPQALPERPLTHTD